MDSARIRGSRWYHVLIGIGLVSYGLVHLLLAWLAGKVAIGGGGDASSQGAMKEVAKQPLGAALLWIMAVGLFSLVIWQILEAIVGHEESDRRRRITRRLSSIGRAIVYAALGVIAVRVAIGSGSSSGKAEDTLSARLMELPAGRFLVAAVGIGVIAVGVSPDRERHPAQVHPARPRRSAPAVGGLARDRGLGRPRASRSGPSAGSSAWRRSPTTPRRPAAWTRPSPPSGTSRSDRVLLFAIAVGIAAFGIYCFFWARHPKY